MAESVRQAMTPDPVTMTSTSSLQQAAAAMRDADIGVIVVVDEDARLRGLVTDRDIIVRAVADGHDATRTTLGEICSTDLLTAAPDDSLNQVAQRMRARAVRRAPVVEGNRTIGIISIGDLAIEQDAGSALADISTAPGNR